MHTTVHNITESSTLNKSYIQHFVENSQRTGVGFMKPCLLDLCHGHSNHDHVAAGKELQQTCTKIPMKMGVALVERRGQQYCGGNGERYDHSILETHLKLTKRETTALKWTGF